VKLPIYYLCPAGNRVSILQDALNDAPEEWPVARGSVFDRCDYCEEGVGDEVCVLRSRYND
jgi:hypothetical protein